MSVTAICIIGWAAFGLVIAFINSRISKAGMKTKSPTFAIAVNFIRLALDAGALAAAFIVCRSADLPLAPSLISVAMALTVGGGIILVRTVKEIQKQLPTEEEELRAEKEAQNNTPEAENDTEE